MVFTQEEKSESMITIIRTEVSMDEDGVTEKLNASGNDFRKNEKSEKEKNGWVEEAVDEDSLFDSLMEKIGMDGKFQRRFDIIYNFILVMCVAMPYLNIILVMTVPDHWCYVPGRELTNFTIEEWKEMHIPRPREFMDCSKRFANLEAAVIISGCRMTVGETFGEIQKFTRSNPIIKVRDPSKEDGFSSCKMYVPRMNDSFNTSTTECQNGWEYDRTWYSETVPSEQNWVCDYGVYVSNVFAAGRVGEIVGTLIFGQLGDQIGRVPVFYISMIVLLFGRIMSIFTSNMYYVFLITTAIGSTASISVFQSPLVISMEISKNSKRSYVAFLQCVGWVIGLCTLAMLAWILKSWQWIMVASTLPCFAYFFMYRMLPESPRWLASKGKIKKSAEVLKYISRINGTTYPENSEEILQKIADKKEKFYGLPTLFFHWRLAKNTILIIFCWGLTGLTYYILVLNVTTMSGNPFMNFFWQSLVELPGYTLGKYLSNLIGRRWTQSGAYFISSLVCIALLLILPLQIPTLEILLVSLLKMCLTVTFYMIWLQAIEIYPTCVRQTGTSLGGMVSNMAGIFGPYIVYLGTSIHQSIPYFVLLGSIVSACIASLFLPETYEEKLPETLEDAQLFGKDQKFWSFKIYKKK